MALDHDFYLTSGATSLGFNKKITPEFPEERATAQFRKEQFDSTPTVGDQSLSGWWTRGQLSFHRGAGLRYYDGGQDAIEGFDTAEGINPFTPGELTLGGLFSSTALAFTDAAPAASASGGVYGITAAGLRLVQDGTTTSIATSTGGIPTSVTVGSDIAYVTNGDKIETLLAGGLTRTNHITNPSFETGTAGWSATGSSLNVSSQGYRGSWSLQGFRDPDTGVNDFAITASGLTIGVTYVFAARVFRTEATVWDLLADSTVLDSTPASLTLGVGWEELRGTFTATGTSHALKVRVNSPLGGSVDSPNGLIDAAMVVESPHGAYFDGSTAGASWAGTAHASKSTIVTSASGPTVALITNSAASWSKIHWAKGRLFCVDADGRWYALPAATATVDATDAFWSSGYTSGTWSVADGPGPVYLARGRDIYAVTLDTDGLVPALSAPTTAATLPAGESVAAMSYYLGYLIVATNRGVRMAAIQNDLPYFGPLVIEGDFSACRVMGVYDKRLYVAGRPEDRDGATWLCALDLSLPNDDLTVAWTPLVELDAASPAHCGAVVDGAGRVYGFASAVWSESLPMLSAAGSLTTAFLRFGTLEDKAFRSVLVRTDGEGEVAVTLIEADGTETSLGTVAAPSTAELPITADPQERVALRFDLTPATSGVSGPTLLGYQLKALPVPKRQRMKRVPLALFDRESNRNGQQMGNDGSAWTRLQALEALEESNAVVDFEDKETGETGSAYIESVEMRRTAPTSRHSDGFGGTVWVTLRVI